MKPWPDLFLFGPFSDEFGSLQQQNFRDDVHSSRDGFRVGSEHSDPGHQRPEEARKHFVPEGGQTPGNEVRSVPEPDRTGSLFTLESVTRT